MNFLEALKSGRPIRRPIPKYKRSNQDGYIDPFYLFENYGYLTRQDALADDWEVKPNKTVTRYRYRVKYYQDIKDLPKWYLNEEECKSDYLFPDGLRIIKTIESDEFDE